jgi:hypothetical protein
MLVESFRLVAARLIPQMTRCKQALLSAALILALCGLAGCGGSSAATKSLQWQTVGGSGFTFEAPAGWKVERAQNRVTVTEGSQLVQISTFPLAKPYSDKLFAPVAKELRSRMGEIGRQTGGTLTALPSVMADGVRSHAYQVTSGDQVDEYVFVLSGMREYLLLCRRTSASSDGSEFCGRLVTSFARR